MICNLVIDEKINQKKLDLFLKGSKPELVRIFYLTDSTVIKNQYKNFFKERSHQIEIVCLKSAIKKGLGFISTNIHNWAYEFGDFAIDGKKIKELFQLDGLSYLHLSYIYEKNPFKTDIFFLSAQYLALSEFIKKGDLLFLCIKNPYLSASLLELANGALSAKVKWGILLMRMRILVHSSIFLLRSLLWKLCAVCCLKNKKDQNQCFENVFVTYFPFFNNVTKKTCKQYENLYFSPLQKILLEQKKNATWYALFIFAFNKKFKDALCDINDFRKEGYDIRLLDESVQIVNVFTRWLSILRCYFKNQSYFFKDQKNLPNWTSPTLAKHLVFISFAGKHFVQNLLFESAFKKHSLSIQNAKKVLYPFEGQSWERAMIHHWKGLDRSVFFIGHQHTSVSLNYFFYFFDPRDRFDKIPLPIPDLVATTGQYQTSLLKKSLYKKIVTAGRLRNTSNLKNEHIIKRKNKIVFLGSYDRQETMAILNFIADFKKNISNVDLNFTIAFHPSCNLSQELVGPYFSGLLSHVSSRGTFEELKECKMAVVANSTAGIDALEAGCKLCLLRFNSVLPLASLYFEEDFVTQVDSPEELLNLYFKLENSAITFSQNQEQKTKIENFLKNYHLVDPNYEKWREILN